MKRILRIGLIAIGACLGLSLLAAIFNGVSGNKAAPPRATVTAISVGLLSRPSPTAPAIPTPAPTLPAIQPTAVIAVATEIPTMAAPATIAPVADGVFVAPQGDSVNVRSGPGTNYPVVGALTTGQSAKAIGRLADNSWVQIELGWVNAGVATVTGALDSVVVVEAPAAPVVDSPAPTPAAAPIADAPTIAPAPVASCDPAYPDVCIPSPPPDLNCGDIPQYKNIRVVKHPDPHGLDKEQDGLACEGN